MRGDIEQFLQQLADTYPMVGELVLLICVAVIVATYGFLAFFLADSVKSGLRNIRAWMAHDDSDGWM